LGKRGPTPPAPFRTCVDCGLTKPIDEHTPIKATAFGYYGRCRVCRARRKRERYHSTPEIRAAEVARASKNQRLRLARRRGETE
jgi:hypothetical protein